MFNIQETHHVFFHSKKSPQCCVLIFSTGCFNLKMYTSTEKGIVLSGSCVVYYSHSLSLKQLATFHKYMMSSINIHWMDVVDIRKT